MVFVSGMTGTQLVDPESGRTVWGRGSNLFRPRDRGYSLALPLGPAAGDHPQSAYLATGPLWDLRVLFWNKKVYRPLRDHFLAEGRRLGRLDTPQPGEDFFFFDYDWRRENVATAFELAERLNALGRKRGARVEEPLPIDLICQSNAAKVCRYLVKYGAMSLSEAEAGAGRPPETYRIRKLILVGASNGGALRTLDFMTRGRRYVPLVGRKISQETFFSIRPLFADLPLLRTDLFFDETGTDLEVDLTDTRTWIEYGWSIFRPKPRRRLERRVRPDLFASSDHRLDYLETRLETASRMQRLLSRDAIGFASTRYYHLENGSVPTAARALLHRGAKGWRIRLFDDGKVARQPILRRLAVGKGDGHATLASQRDLSHQEEAALAASRLIVGGHFEMIIEPEGLEALSDFLAD